MSLASRGDIPAIDAALAQLTTALTCLTCADAALQGHTQITVHFGLCRYHARREIDGMRTVLLGLKRACEAERMQRASQCPLCLGNIATTATSRNQPQRHEIRCDYRVTFGRPAPGC